MNLSFKFTLFSLLFLCVEAQAQLAASSLFSEVKSINPALISSRRQGQYTFIASSDSYEKNQEISEDKEAILDSKISGVSFFRGGKSSGFITTELSLITQSGNREIKISEPDPVNMDSDINFTYAQLAFSLGRYIGMGITKQDFLLDQKFAMNFGGTDYNSDEEIKRSSLGLKIGALIPIGAIRASVYYEVVSVTQEVKSERPALPESSTNPQNKFIGIGLGYVSSNFHFEVGLEQFLNPEKGLQEPEEDPEPSSRNRLSLTLESKLYGLTLGYTGRIYEDGYLDPEQTVVNQLIYGNSLEDRTEHIINFSLGGSSGLSLGGSITYSETEGEEISPIEPAALNRKYKTKTTQMGAMVKLGYVW